MTGRRSAARAENIATIKTLARQQISEKGANNLSLREIARDMNVASSALYRYFESRDQLLTELIVDAYNELGDIVEQADASRKRSDLGGRFSACAHAMRSWAITHPSDFALIFGTPIPDYVAPEKTIAAGTRYTTTLLKILADKQESLPTSFFAKPISRNLQRQYASVAKKSGVHVNEETMRTAMAAWAMLIGAITLEVFGQFNNFLTTPRENFDAVITLASDTVLFLS